MKNPCSNTWCKKPGKHKKNPNRDSKSSTKGKQIYNSACGNQTGIWKAGAQMAEAAAPTHGDPWAQYINRLSLACQLN